MKKKGIINNKQQVINDKHHVINNKIHSSQLLPFAISLGIFLIAAVFGWVKLRYGFNFIDEGYHMTEAWRLTVGDNFFSDKFTGALTLSTFINALVFKIYPGITLLGFREVQFSLTIISLLMLSFALYKISKDFWFQPLIFSIFAFTGLDPIGMISNLYYQTYPHLFLTFYLAFFILALHQQSVLLKRILYITAGIFLWLISFSLLHMSLVVIAVVLFFVIIKIFKLKSLNFNFTDLCFVMSPVLFLWMIFIGIYGNDFINNLISSIQMILSSHTHGAGSLLSINWEALKHVIIALLFTIAFLWSTKLSKTAPLVGILSILSIIMFLAIDTCLFGLIKPYNGWFDRPMWFAALLLSSYFLFLCYFIFKVVKKAPWSNYELYALILFIPSIVAAINSSIFSGLGFLTVLHSSIPAVAATACAILSMETIKKRADLVKVAILILFFAPFYYTASWSDWKFTFFDVAPEQANVDIETGFGKGIKTNQIYKDLYGWISTTSQAYSNKDDYMISYVVSPMVHMIAQRRPALDDTFIDIGEFSEDYYRKAIEFMKDRGRRPMLAYVFEAMPILMPITLENPERIWSGKQFSFPFRDPVSQYIFANMTQVESFPISNKLFVRCFVDNASALRVLEIKLKKDPTQPELNLFMGNFYQQKGDFENAGRYYQKALDTNSKFIPALKQLAINQVMKGNDLDAANILKKIVAIDPSQIGSYYNIARIYARQKQIDDSIMWLTKAVDKGFNNWKLLLTDHDLDNIRDNMYYKKIIKKIEDSQSVVE